MDKAPDAFRTISEVADDLDIPQHVLRFWETRFAQIKPMKRSGGRRYYRPDDVDLLRGIRRLLYGEGYTIRGVQRILKEHGIASVQRLADASAVASFGAIEEVVGQSILEQDDEAAPSIDLDDDDYDGAERKAGFSPGSHGARARISRRLTRTRFPAWRSSPRLRRGAAEGRAAGPDRLPAIAGCRAEGWLAAPLPRNRHWCVGPAGRIAWLARRPDQS